MKRWLVLALTLAVIAPTFGSAQAGPRRRVERRAERRVARRVVRHRTFVVVGHGWPLRRPLREVWVHPARGPVRMGPRVFLATAVFTGVVVAASSAPAHDALVWEDGETLARDDDWTEITLNCDARGTRLWLEIPAGKVQFDWAEVVFENGEARVVDFKEKTYGPGLYSLLDFRDGRKVDHVRFLGKAKSDEARVVLRMEK